MTIRQFIQATFDERARKLGALVVYDPDRRFREVVLAMADERCEVADATDSFIEAHEQVVRRWVRAAEPLQAERLIIIYVPMEAPRTDEERCQDPFSHVASGSDWFPRYDEDRLESLSERAKPEYVEKIRELFAAGTPDLATLEAVGAGNTWPCLQTLLGVESTTDILLALLIPNPTQEEALRSDGGWIEEARTLFDTQLGFNPRTKSRKLAALGEELWRLILFSEFAYDLPEPLPDSLAGVPTAKVAAKALVNRICDSLRQERHHHTYIDRADRIARELGLEERMRHVEDLGRRDTFAFEERSFLRQYVKQMLAGDLGAATAIAAQRRDSVWVRHTDRGLLWTVAGLARELLVAADDLERDLGPNSKSLDDLIQFYASRGCRLDQSHREMEKAVAEAFGVVEGIEELLDVARTHYHSAIEAMQSRFMGLTVKEGWPVEGRLRATQVFDRVVGPLLEVRGKRVALFFVDALRFELAASLERQLAANYTCRLRPACAQLPTITAVGMAALLPQADGNLVLKRYGDELVPTLSGKPVRVPTERFEYVKTFYGDRVRMVSLDSLVAPGGGTKKQAKAFEGIDLLMVKTTEIDEQGELDASNVCVLIPHILGRLMAAVGRLQKLGFHHVVFCADHGFVLHSNTSAGNNVTKPPGDWVQVKDRCLLGSGSANPETVLILKEQVGISGEFDSYVVPRSFGTFTKRHPYFHEGLSLQECVIPVLEIDLGKADPEAKPRADVQLRYRGEGQATVTTRRPVVEISVFGGELFQAEVVFQLEAKAKSGQDERVVGEAASCSFVDPATGMVKVRAGQAVKVPLRIDDDFCGQLEVRALDPETGIVYGLPLKLKLDIIA